MKLVVLIVGLSLAGAIAWFAAEQHYDNCVQAATAEHPLGDAGLKQEERDSQNPFDTFRDDPPPDVSGRPLERRQEAIEGCSRLPW